MLRLLPACSQEPASEYSGLILLLALLLQFPWDAMSICQLKQVPDLPEDCQSEKTGINGGGSLKSMGPGLVCAPGQWEEGDTHYRERGLLGTKKELLSVEHFLGWVITCAISPPQLLFLAGITIPSSENQTSERLTNLFRATETVSENTWGSVKILSLPVHNPACKWHGKAWNVMYEWS